MKKRISTANFETSSIPDVTAKKPIGNMYFMYIDMAWFHSLSELEHDMLHSTVWPVHIICPLSNAYVLTALSDSHEKNDFFTFPSRNAILITDISDYC